MNLLANTNKVICYMSPLMPHRKKRQAIYVIEPNPNPYLSLQKNFWPKSNLFFSFANNSLAPPFFLWKKLKKLRPRSCIPDLLSVGISLKCMHYRTPHSYSVKCINLCRYFTGILFLLVLENFEINLKTHIVTCQFLEEHNATSN